ncbi:MAG: FecR domain-containing protein, partial [Myxococcaceae bacterium]|nr:FecR domain-containing protein [Myxococcaceae bacterium]
MSDTPEQNELAALGQRVAQALEPRPADERMLAKVKARFHAQVGQKRVPERRVWVAFAAGAAVAAMLAAGVFFVRLESTPVLAASVRGKAGSSADFVSARVADQPIDFSDGSEVIVRKGSQLRVSGVTRDGAAATLERGSAHVSVIHREKTSWVFTAGPYRVFVVGTKFELSWNPDSTGLAVQMEEGTVEIEGPGMSRRRVSGVERFDSPEALDVEPPPAEPVAVRPPKARAKVAAPAVAPAPPAGTPTWRYLADTGDAAGALRAAEAAGFTSLSRSLVQQDVLLLADVAREARDPARALEAYGAARDRFPGTQTAVEGAMGMGHVFEGSMHDRTTAAKWYERAYRERPNGPSAAEALGSAMECLEDEPARAVAREYLRRFP